MWHVWVTEEMHSGFLWRDLIEQITCENNIKIYLKWDWERWTGLLWLKLRVVACACERFNETSGTGG
jgi:hypothetical protein